MRALPWIIRVSLFALGFGLGFSQYQPEITSYPVTLEIYLAIPDSKPSSQIKSPGDPACTTPLPLEKAPTRMSRVRL